MPHAADIYAEHLYSREHGLPLWCPEPSERGEVQIGDVGYVDKGGFYRIFNAMYPADHPINADGVPDTFEPLNINPRRIHKKENYLPPGPMCSQSVHKTNITSGAKSKIVGGGMSCHFKCNEDSGALLVLKDSATLTEVHRSRFIEEYVRKNHASWFTFATERLGLALKPEDLMLVRGFVKTSEWVVATFRDKGEELEFSLQAGLEPYAGASFSASVSSHLSTSVEYRWGPKIFTGKKENYTPGSPPSTGESRIRDQCVFLSAYKMQRRLGFPPSKITAAADHNRDNSPSPPDSPGPAVRAIAENADSVYDLCELPSTSLTCDPLNQVLENILKNSDVDAAIADHSHNDLKEDPIEERSMSNSCGLTDVDADQREVQDRGGPCSTDESLTFRTVCPGGCGNHSDVQELDPIDFETHLTRPSINWSLQDKADELSRDKADPFKSRQADLRCILERQNRRAKRERQTEMLPPGTDVVKDTFPSAPFFTKELSDYFRCYKKALYTSLISNATPTTLRVALEVAIRSLESLCCTTLAHNEPRIVNIYSKQGNQELHPCEVAPKFVGESPESVLLSHCNSVSEIYYWEIALVCQRLKAATFQHDNVGRPNSYQTGTQIDICLQKPNSPIAWHQTIIYISTRNPTPLSHSEPRCSNIRCISEAPADTFILSPRVHPIMGTGTCRCGRNVPAHTLRQPVLFSTEVAVEGNTIFMVPVVRCPSCGDLAYQEAGAEHTRQPPRSRDDCRDTGSGQGHVFDDLAIHVPVDTMETYRCHICGSITNVDRINIPLYPPLVDPHTLCYILIAMF